MAKTITVPGSPRQLYDYTSYWSPEPPNPVVTVGTLSALYTAISNATPNTTIEILPGTYNLTDTLIIGTPNLTFRGATGNRGDVILNGRGMDNASYGNVPHGFWCNTENLHIEDMTLRNFYTHGVTFGSGANAPRLSNLAIRDCGEQFLKVSAFPLRVDNGIIEDCLMEYTAGPPTTDHGAGLGYIGFIDVHRAWNWIVRRNTLKNGHVPDTAAYWWSPAILFWNYSANTIVERNTIINCDRAIALGLDNKTGLYEGGNLVQATDHLGGVVRNNMVTLTPGLFSPERTADSDGQIIVWQSPSTKVLHNTVLTNGQVADALQFRWDTAGSEARNNLFDDSIRTRDAATYASSDNILNAQSNYFVDASQGNLRLSSTGNSSVGTAARQSSCIDDIDGIARSNPTKIGAHIYG